MAADRLTLPIAIAVAAAIALGGCGGDDEQSSAGGTGPAAPKPSTDSVPGRANEKRRDDRGASANAQRGRKRGNAGRSKRKRHPRTRADALRRIPPRLRAKVVKHYVRVVLSAFDLKASRIRVSYGGIAVDLTLPGPEACKTRPDELRRILKALRQAVPYPRTVDISVAGNDQPLAAYRASCEQRAAPRGRGRVVFSKSGSHVYQTRPFRIRSKRWTIEYVSEGSFFQVFVFRGKRGQPGPITETRPGSGKRTYKGAGRFRLYISGSRDWTVRVRDGG